MYIHIYDHFPNMDVALQTSKRAHAALWGFFFVYNYSQMLIKIDYKTISGSLNGYGLVIFAMTRPVGPSSCSRVKSRDLSVHQQTTPAHQRASNHNHGDNSNGNSGHFNTSLPHYSTCSG